MWKDIGLDRFVSFCKVLVGVRKGKGCGPQPCRCMHEHIRDMNDGYTSMDVIPFLPRDMQMVLRKWINLTILQKENWTPRPRPWRLFTHVRGGQHRRAYWKHSVSKSSQTIPDNGMLWCSSAAALSYRLSAVLSIEHPYNTTRETVHILVQFSTRHPAFPFPPCLPAKYQVTRDGTLTVLSPCSTAYRNYRC